MIYILIPAHNEKLGVFEILKCLKKQTNKNFKIILVDDGSTDNTEAEVKKNFPDVVILRGNGNLWWTGANVIGINYIIKQSVDNDFILLLNNDVIVKEDYLENLLNASLLNNRAIAGSTLVDYNDHSFIEGGIKIDKNLNLIVNRNKEKIKNEEFDMNVDVLSGRGTLIPIEVFKKIGNFNHKKLPHYGADYEFSIRAKRNNFKLIVSHKAKVFAKLHITGFETPTKKIITLKECFNLLFSKKSKTNIIYYLNYVWLCSEKKYRGVNLINSFRGILLNTLFKTFPLFFLTLSISKMFRISFFILKIFLQILNLKIKNKSKFK